MASQKPPSRQAPRRPQTQAQAQAAPVIQPEASGLTNVIARLERDAKSQRDAQGKELNERIEATLMRSIDIQAKGNAVAKRQNLKDLKSLRTELKLASNGSGGTHVKEFEDIFDKLINQSVETSGLVSKLAGDMHGGFLAKLPTLDNLVSLASASNPMIALGLKVVGSAGRMMKEAKAKADAERGARLANVKSEADAISLKLKKLKDEKEGKLTPANDSKGGGADRDENGKFIKGGQSAQVKQLDVLIKIYERLGGSQAELEKSVEAQKVANRLAAKAQQDAQVAKLQGLENAKESRFKLLPAANDAKVIGKGDGGKSGGMIGNILGEAVGNMVGKWVPGFLTKGLGGKGFGKIFESFGGIFKTAGKFLKVAGKASGIITIIMTAFDFFDGFSNAASVLGKENPSVIDKVMSGFIGVWKGIAGIADTVAGLFGFDTNLAGMVEKGLATLYNNYMSGFYNAVADFITNGVKQIVSFGVSSVGLISEFFDGKKKMFSDLFQAVSDFDVGEFMTDVKLGFKKKVEDMFSFVKDSIQDLLVNGIGSLVEMLPEFARTDAMNNIIKQKTDLQIKKDQANFPKTYEKTADNIKEEKAKKEEEKAKSAAGAVVQQNNNTNVSNNTSVSAPKISTTNPDQGTTGGMFTFG